MQAAANGVFLTVIVVHRFLIICYIRLVSLDSLCDIVNTSPGSLIKHCTYRSQRTLHDASPSRFIIARLCTRFEHLPSIPISVLPFAPGPRLSFSFVLLHHPV